MEDTTNGEDLTLKVTTCFFETALGETDVGRMAWYGLSGRKLLSMSCDRPIVLHSIIHQETFYRNCYWGRNKLGQYSFRT